LEMTHPAKKRTSRTVGACPLGVQEIERLCGVMRGGVGRVLTRE